MNTHDLRIKYTDEFLAKGTKVSSADEALGIKAVDYIAFAPKIDANQGLSMVESVCKCCERRIGRCDYLLFPANVFG